MSDVAIQVDNLGKQYRIGVARQRAGTLRAAAGDAADAFIRRLTRRGGQDEAGKFWALRGISFELKRGEVLGVIGPNGAGKSTLLKILSRITEPTEGEVLIRGRVGSLLEVGSGFRAELTGRENIFLNGAILGMRQREIQRKFDAIVDFSGVERFIDTPVKRYSSGMYMRLAFAVAAHYETEVLLVDEVLAVGDAEFQKKCLGKMGEVAQAGRTVLMVSHNTSAIKKLCASSILIEKSEMTAHGPTADVIDQYQRLDEAAKALRWQRTTPPAGDAYFHCAQLVDSRGEPFSEVTTDDAVKLAVDYSIVTMHSDLQLSVDVQDAASGEVIFTSAVQDGGTCPADGPGMYRAIVTLPPDVFVPRSYVIRISLWSPVAGTFDRFQALSFAVSEAPSFYNSTPGGRLGLIALRCPWVVERTGQ